MSSAIVKYLVENGESAFVLEHYVHLDDSGKSSAIQSLMRLDEPVGASAFYEGMNQDDLYLAAVSFRAIEHFGLESEMPVHSRAALDQWKKNPMFLLDTLDSTLDNDERSKAILEIFSRIKKHDVHAAKVYWRGMDRLLAEHRDAAMEGIDSCIGAYVKSRE